MRTNRHRYMDLLIHIETLCEYQLPHCCARNQKRGTQRLRIRDTQYLLVGIAGMLVPNRALLARFQIASLYDSGSLFAENRERGHLEQIKLREVNVEQGLSRVDLVWWSWDFRKYRSTR
jgi:hypothetical protein